MIKKTQPDILKRLLVAFSRINLANQALTAALQKPLVDDLEIRQWEKLRTGFEAEIFDLLSKGNSEIRILHLYALLEAINKEVAGQVSSSSSDDLALVYYSNLKTRCSKSLFDLLTPLKLDYNLAA